LVCQREFVVGGSFGQAEARRSDLPRAVPRQQQASHKA